MVNQAFNTKMISISPSSTTMMIMTILLRIVALDIGFISKWGGIGSFMY